MSKIIDSRAALVAAAVLATAGPGCGGSNDTHPAQETAARPDETEAADASGRANRFFERAFEDRLERSPMFQARLGIKKSYDKWDDLSATHAAENLALVERQLAALKETIDYDLLDAQARLSYDLFVTDAEQEISDYKFRYHNYPVNQMRGWQSRVPAFLINYHRIDSTDDAWAYVERLKNVEPLFEQLISGLKIRAEQGIVPPKFIFPQVIRDCHNVLDGAPFDGSGHDSTILGDFRLKVQALDVSDEKRREMVDQASLALLMFVRPAYERLIAYLTELEKRATEAAGVWKLPDGKAFYRHMLRKTTTTRMGPWEIYQLGRHEVTRIHAEMRQIMKRVGFEGSLEEFFEFLRKDKRFYYENTEKGREAYLLEARAIIDRMRGRLDGLFMTTPNADIVVKAVEPFREASTGKAFYQRPSPDGARPGIYYANLHNMADMPRYQMEALAYHEGIPGHHMQLALAIELKDIPRFRRYGSYTAYIEGWGLYAEFIPKEIGFYNDPYADFGRLAMELWRACRLVVDTGIHSLKWSRSRAINYLLKNTPNPRGDVEKAIDRYVVMPGQATAYKIGMLKLLELRKNARQQLGPRFDIREFHDIVLGNGPVPLTTLEKIVDEWIESKSTLQ